MADLSIRFQNISFAYDSATHFVINDLSAHLTRGWTGIVGANGAGKSTVLKLATGRLTPQKGRVIFPESAIYCEQRTDKAPAQLWDLTQAIDGAARKIKGRLGVEDDWLERWNTLSHGERKRAQIAVALWRQPQVLAIDEPTNHLDAQAQHLLFEALSSFSGVGLLVSHDRKFLDDLCYQCLFIEPPDAILRPGNYSHGLQLAENDQNALKKEYDQAKNEFSRLKREAGRRRDAAGQANRKRSKKGLALKDHDAKARLDLARVSGKDGSAGKQLNQLSGRLARAQKKMSSIKVRKTYKMGIWISSAKSSRNTLFHLPAGSLSLGGDRWLSFSDLSMQPDDRIALTGLNGCGKSTLVNHIIRSLNLPMDHVAYLPQEIDLQASLDVMELVRDFSNEKLGQMMTVVSCLGSRPHGLLESQRPSPGEVRKLMLAIGIVKVPHLIIMDEPTNHLDLPSIKCMEQALMDCPCGLLLVSHDQRFINSLAQKRWHISEDKEIKGQFILETGFV